MVLHISVVGNRFACGRAIRVIAKDKDYGLINNVKMQRISMLVWHLEFDAHIKES